jgi:hypothetical protein
MSISGFSSKYHGTNRKMKLHERTKKLRNCTVQNYKDLETYRTCNISYIAEQIAY